MLTGSQGGTFSSSTGIIIDAQTGTITPATSIPGSYTVTYTIVPSAPCPGFTTNTTVTITKAPAASITYNVSNICNSVSSASAPNPPITAILTGSGGGMYSISPATGLPINSATGTITPSGAGPGVYTVTYSIPGAGGCTDYNTNTTITVSGAPATAISYPASPYCRGINTPQPVSSSGTAGGTFSSTQGLSIDTVTGAINPSLSLPGTYTVTYTIVASLPCPGFTTTTTVVVDDSPVITFPLSSQAICSGSTAEFIPSSTVANTVYNWTVTGVLPPNVTGITSGSSSGPNAAISLSFTNTGTVTQSVNVDVNPVNPSQSSCAGSPYTLTVIINPIPPAPIADTINLCMGTPATRLSLSPLAGNTINWYDAGFVLLNAAPVITTRASAQFIYYASESNTYGCESTKSPVPVFVHPTLKIVSSSYTNPAICGVPSGSIILNVLDINNNSIPNYPVVVHYDKFQTAYAVADSTDASGKITLPLVAGTYSGIYVETFGCASQKIPDIFILKDPLPPSQPVAGYNPPLCSESALNLSRSISNRFTSRAS